MATLFFFQVIVKKFLLNTRSIQQWIISWN